jgi:hypothetical protein
MTLSITQQNHLKMRVSEVLEKKRSGLRAKHLTKGKTLSKFERAKLIRTGKVGLRSDVDRIDYYDDVVKVFDFSKHEYEDSYDEEKISEVIDSLESEANTIRDEIVLGDEKKARQLLAAFEKRKV